MFVPAGKDDPEGGTHVTPPPHSPVRVGSINVTTAAQSFEATFVTMLFGQTMSHANTLTVKLQVIELLDVSMAVHVTVLVPVGKQKPDGGEQKLVRTTQLSVTVGPLKLTTTHGFVLPTTMSDGQVIIGASMSCTITLKVLVLLLPDESMAVQDTVLVPTSKVEPLTGEHTTVTFVSQLSVAVAVKVTLLLEHWPVSALPMMSGGTLIAGACVSFTITRNVHPFVLPELSVATPTTVFVPFGKVEPEGGVNVTLVTVQLSVAFVVNVTTAEH
jgi:hypothetical protein